MSWESKAKWSQSCCNRNEIEIKRGAPRNSNHDDHDVERKEKRCHRYTHHDTYYVLLLLSSIRGRNKYSFHENKWRMLRQGPTQYQSRDRSHIERRIYFSLHFIKVREKQNIETLKLKTWKRGPLAWYAEYDWLSVSTFWEIRSLWYDLIYQLGRLPWPVQRFHWKIGSNHFFSRAQVIRKKHFD